MNGYAVWLGTLMLAFLSAQTSSAQPAPSAEALAATAQIDIQANKICVRPSTYGYQTTVGGQVGGQLNIAKEFSELLSANIGASTNIKNTHWAGVVQTDAAKAIMSGNNCAERMFTLIFNRFFPIPVQSTTEMTPNTSDFKTISVYPTKSVYNAYYAMSTDGT